MRIFSLLINVRSFSFQIRSRYFYRYVMRFIWSDFSLDLKKIITSEFIVCLTDIHYYNYYTRLQCPTAGQRPAFGGPVYVVRISFTPHLPGLSTWSWSSHIVTFARYSSGNRQTWPAPIQRIFLLATLPHCWAQVLSSRYLYLSQASSDQPW